MKRKHFDRTQAVRALVEKEKLAAFRSLLARHDLSAAEYIRLCIDRTLKAEGVNLPTNSKA